MATQTSPNLQSVPAQIIPLASKLTAPSMLTVNPAAQTLSPQELEDILLQMLARVMQSLDQIMLDNNKMQELQSDAAKLTADLSQQNYQEIKAASEALKVATQKQEDDQNSFLNICLKYVLPFVLCALAAPFGPAAVGIAIAVTAASMLLMNPQSPIGFIGKDIQEIDSPLTRALVSMLVIAIFAAITAGAASATATASVATEEAASTVGEATEEAASTSASRTKFLAGMAISNGMSTLNPANDLVLSILNTTDMSDSDKKMWASIISTVINLIVSLLAMKGTNMPSVGTGSAGVDTLLSLLNKGVSVFQFGGRAYVGYQAGMSDELVGDIQNSLGEVYGSQQLIQGAQAQIKIGSESVQKSIEQTMKDMTAGMQAALSWSDAYRIEAQELIKA